MNDEKCGDSLTINAMRSLIERQEEVIKSLHNDVEEISNTLNAWKRLAKEAMVILIER